MEGFKERRKAFVAWFDGYNVPDWIDEEFKKFAADGQKNETSRLYISVNKRNEQKVKKALAQRLIDDVLGDGKIELTHMQGNVAALAAKVENRAENHWLFDFDDDSTKIDDFVEDVYYYSNETPGVFPTKNGYAVIVDHGFDTRELLAKWPNVGLKKDDLLLVSYIKKLTDTKNYAAICIVSTISQSQQRNREKAYQQLVMSEYRKGGAPVWYDSNSAD